MKLYVVGLVMSVSALTALAQQTSDCMAISKSGIFDKDGVLPAEAQYQQILAYLDNDQIRSRGDLMMKAPSIAVDLSLPFKGRWSSDDDFESWKQAALHSTFHEARTAGLSADGLASMSASLASAWKSCLNREGLYAYIIPGADPRSFSINVEFAPHVSGGPDARGTISIWPAKVAASCGDGGGLDRPIAVGRESIRLQCKRDVSDRVRVVVSTDQGSQTIAFEPYFAPVPSVQFSLDHPVILSGGHVYLAWNVTDARRVQLNGADVRPWSGQRISPASSTDYTLLVTSMDGKDASVVRHVEVLPPEPPAAVIAGRLSLAMFDSAGRSASASPNVKIAVECGGSVIASATDDRSPSFGGRDIELSVSPTSGPVLSECTLKIQQSPLELKEFSAGFEFNYSDGTRNLIFPKKGTFSAGGSAELAVDLSLVKREIPSDGRCLEQGQVTSKLSPVDLWRSWQTCVYSGRYEDAVFQYSVASSFALFDSERVTDQRLREFASSMSARAVPSIREGWRDRFRVQLESLTGNPSTRAALCAQVERVGPPTYSPTYLTYTGPGKPPAGLIDGFDFAHEWPRAVQRQLRCGEAPT